VKNRKGMHLLASAMAFGVLGLAFGAIQSMRAKHTQQWLVRTRAEQAARDLTASALAEATHELMEDANRPGAAVFQTLRRTRTALFAPKLTRSRALFARHELAIENAEVLVGEAKPLHEEVPFEWIGRAMVRVTVASLAPARFVFEGVQEREVRAACIAPVPFDRAIRIDVNRPLADQEPLPPDIPAPLLTQKAPPMPIPVALWRARATLVVQPDAQGRVQGAFDTLLNRLGRVSGIVLVDNAGRAPLSLRNLTFHGQAIIVVTGAVNVADVRLGDPACDLLSIVAFGDCSLDGTIEAALVLTEPKEGAGRPAERRAGSRTRIRGAYVVTAGPSPLRPDALVEPLDTLVATDKNNGAVDARRIHVAISPQLISHTIGGL
jgi:hypothetical protein